MVGAQDTPQADPARFPITFMDLGWMILTTVFFVLALLGFGLILTFMGLDIAGLAPGQGFIFVATLVQSAYMVGCVYVVGMRRRSLDWRSIGLRPVSKRWLLIAALIAVAGIPAVTIVTVTVQALLDRPFASPQADLIAPEGFNWFGAFGMVFAAGIVAPFAEELVFRGVLYRVLRNFWPVLPAAVVSSVLFGLMHGFVEVFPGTMLLGFVMALAYERSGTLWVPFVIHAVYNSLSLTMLFVFLAMGIDLAEGVGDQAGSLDTSAGPLAVLSAAGRGP